MVCRLVAVCGPCGSISAWVPTPCGIQQAVPVYEEQHDTVWCPDFASRQWRYGQNSVYHGSLSAIIARNYRPTGFKTGPGDTPGIYNLRDGEMSPRLRDTVTHVAGSVIRVVLVGTGATVAVLSVECEDVSRNCRDHRSSGRP